MRHRHLPALAGDPDRAAHNHEALAENQLDGLKRRRAIDELEPRRIVLDVHEDHLVETPLRHFVCRVGLAGAVHPVADFDDFLRAEQVWGIARSRR